MTDEREDRTETHLLRLHLSQLRVRRFRLEVTEGVDLGLRAESEGEDFSIGTAEGNRLVLRDQTVSRHHCIIETRGQGFVIRDLDSTNGTWVNDLRVQGAYLREPASVRVGVTRLQFTPLAGDIAQELSLDEKFGEVVGRSPEMRRLFALLRRIADSDAALLLQGETGTGKTALAQAVHENSPRRGEPFITLDCASIPPTLIESELFGHDRGSFTGATTDRAGAIEEADGGTLFLDEIGELPLDMQAKLLRAIEARVVQRVGSSRPRPIDFRVIAATNRELRKEVNRGAFRADLYYRLNTFSVTVPPLRQRREDIPILIEKFAAAMGAEKRALDVVTMVGDLWQRREWLGNARELRSAVHRMILLGTEERLGVPRFSSMPPPPTVPEILGTRSLAAAQDFSVSFRDAKAAAVAEWEREYVRALLARNDGNLSKAARAVDMDRNYLRSLAKRHGLE